MVKVAAPPERGAATEAALRAVADALDLPPRAVTLSHGATSRHKVVELDVAEADRDRCQERLAQLLGPAAGEPRR